jgi:hypothetical protein
MDEERRELNVDYWMGSHSADGSPPPVSVALLSKCPVKKAITKRYKDGRTLTLVVDDDELIEKMMTFRWEWDYEKVREELVKGETVNFKHWKKGGLDVGLTFFGSYMIGKTWSLDFSKVTKKTLCAEAWQVEVNNDVAFPMIDLKKLQLETGFSRDEKENPVMQSLMHDMVLDSLAKNDGKKRKLESSTVRKEESDKSCDYCGECPCVWVTEREAVVASDANENGHTFTIFNKTRRKMAYKHMYRVVHGPGQTGVRKQLPECVECGVRALFPDEQAKYMGYKEE